MNPPDFSGGIRIVVDGNESVQGRHHQVTVNKLKHVDCVLGLVGGGAQLDQRPDLEAVAEVDLENSGVGLVVVPCEDGGYRVSLASCISHLEYLALSITYVLRNFNRELHADSPSLHR